ncbi:MAG: SDR family oxidoreductase [Patescibacteria group bacterium]
MSKNVLVTGAAGFIGSNLCEELVKRDWNVIGLDNLMAGYRKNIEHLEKEKNFRFIWADIRNYADVEKIIRENKITHVAHQAARGSVPKSVEDPILTNDINIGGTLNVLWAAHKNGVTKFVSAISSSVYGDTPTLPKVETMPYAPLSPYALTKVAKEMYCEMFWKLYGLKTIGLRYFNVYGRRQDPNGDYAAVIPRWITKALQGGNLPINGDGKQTRDFTYIDDVVSANILALECRNKKAFGRGFNIGYSDRNDIKTLAETIIKITRSKAKVVYGPPRKGDIQDSYADITLAKELLGYAPKTSLSQGIQKTLSWYRKNFNL